MKFLATAVILAATAMSLAASACDKGMDASSIRSKTDSNKYASLMNSGSTATANSAAAVKGTK